MRLISLVFVFICPLIASTQCENSLFKLTKVEYTEKGVELHTRLILGTGTNGKTKGASNGTGSFTFAFYSQKNSMLSEFAPKRIKGKNTLCMNSGVMHQAGFNEANQMLTFSSNACKFTCVNSEIKCGTMQIEEYDFKFIFDQEPDSIRVFGIEGNGNPFAGCFNSDKMLLNLSEPKLEFKGFRIVNHNSSIEVNWQVEKGALSKEFEIQRSCNGLSFNTIEKVIPQFNDCNNVLYSYLDNGLIPGIYVYRIKHIDWFGNEHLSKELKVKIEANSMMLSLNERKGWIEVDLKKKRPTEIVLYNFEFEEINQEIHIHKGTLRIKNEGLIPGIYHLKTEYRNEFALTKLIIL